jgi:ElaB/YqjD/DUF883 family membrane-anchored ribosome-binding protein
MEETRDIAMVALREEFGQLVTHLTDRMNSNDGKPKMLKTSMFNKLHEFLDSFSARNVFDDQKLIELADQARQVVSGASSYSMQYNDVMRKKIQKGMNDLKDAIDQWLSRKYLEGRFVWQADNWSVVMTGLTKKHNNREGAG